MNHYFALSIFLLLFTMNPLNIANLLVKEFSECSNTTVTLQEEDFAYSLKEVIVQAIEHGSTYTERVHDLVCEGIGIDTVEVYDPDADLEEFREDPDEVNSKGSSTIIELQYKKNAVSFWRNAGGRKPLSFKTVRNRFKKVKEISTLYRWQRQIEAGGPYRKKLKEISSHTFELFSEAKRNHRPVHDLDLRKWALQKGLELNCIHFKASKFWLHGFKRKHRIVSRKITKFVSKKDLIDKEMIENNALDFLIEAMPLVDEYGKDNVFNSDQSGFQFEIHSGRTLTEKGEKKVEIIAQSKNALTHSYTIMPAMSASGKLVEPLYMVLQETDGKFGPRVLETLYRPPNVYIAASKSGKMGKEHLNDWMKNIIIPALGSKGLLIVDAWSTFTSENMQKNIPEQTDIKIMQIPPGATGKIQPWDVYGFRFYKNMVRHISDYVILMDVDLVLSQRNNCIKLQSLVYNQLCSPRYTPLFEYSWFKSGYVTVRPDRFPNPVHFAFQGSGIRCSECTQNVKYITCSWCQKDLCFTDFFINNHLCKTFVE